jgi:hypothetical protein
MDGIPDAMELTRKTLEVLGVEEYNEKARYPNPLKNAKDGKSYNWDSATSGFIPANTVNFILSSDSIPKGIAQVAKSSIQKFEEYTDGPRVAEYELIGLVEELSFRFGLGACAEKVAKETLISNGANVQEPEDGDENKSIDIRTETSLNQVKLADSPRSDWKEPKDNIKSDCERDKNILWVKHDSTVLVNSKPDERLIKDRFEPI